MLVSIHQSHGHIAVSIPMHRYEHTHECTLGDVVVDATLASKDELTSCVWTCMRVDMCVDMHEGIGVGMLVDS